MSKIIDKITNYMLPLAQSLSDNKYLNILRDAFMLAFPFTMFGSIVTVLLNLPFYNDSFKNQLILLFGNGVYSSMSIMTVFVAFGIGFYTARYYKNNHNVNVEAVFSGAVSLASFLILTPFLTVTENGETIEGVLSLQRLGAQGMFVGMLSAFLAGEMYCRMTRKGWRIHMPDSVPPAVAKSFASLIPSTLTLGTFLIINAIFVGPLKTNVHDMIYTFLQKPLIGLGSSLWATLIAIFFIQLLWFFGLHGQTIINSVMDPIWISLMLVNLEAFQKNQVLPNIISKAFMETFTVGLGGTGMTLIIVILMAFRARSQYLKDVGRVALGPGLFNVNEPIIFGLPIVLNPIALIPWVITPMVVTCFNYFMMASGIFPIPTGVQVPWTVPVVISGVLATNSWLGGLLQIIDMIIVVAIWYPFIRTIDKMNRMEETE